MVLLSAMDLLGFSRGWSDALAAIQPLKLNPPVTNRGGTDAQTLSSQRPAWITVLNMLILTACCCNQVVTNSTIIGNQLGLI